MDEQTRAALAEMLRDLREYHGESEDSAEKYPGRQYLTEDLERRLAELLGE